MAWIYLAESAESQKPWKVTSGQSPTVKTIDMLKLSSCPVCNRAICQPHPSGMTSEHSRDRCFLRQLRSFMADFRVRTFPLQDAEKAWKESEADYFSRSQGSSAKYDPDSSSWRTSQRLLFEEQNELLESFAAYGMTVDGEFFPLRMWERITRGTGGGSLPTPRAQDSYERSNWKTIKDANEGGKAQMTLTRKVKYESKMWRTPDAHCDRGASSQKRMEWKLKNKMPISLNDQVRWPTPDCSDRRSAKSKQQGLSNMVKKWPTQVSHDAKDTGTAPSEGRRNTPNLAYQAGGQLNPTWVEWLMGYPSEWTVLKDWAILWYRPRRVKRSKD
jgi:hypothetical protein